MFKVNKVSNKHLLVMLTIQTPERGQWRRSILFIVNFEQISDIVLVFAFLIWASKYRICIFDKIASSILYMSIGNEVS